MTAEPDRPLGTVRPRDLALVAALALLLYVPFLGSSTLWDPWETHYAEVARRMLEEHDWVKLRWQNEDFRSKPVLTFWLMAAGMKVFGVARDGGYSGELVATSRPVWAVRLPFALFGVGGVVMLWLALARLYSKRAAWLAAVILATSPTYAMISRQAITDMPSCALFIAAMACFALALFDERPASRTARGVFLAVFAVVVLPQLAYFVDNLRGTAVAGLPGSWLMLIFIAGFVIAATVVLRRTTSMRQVYLSWFYLLNGVAVLAKGPVAPALAGLTILAYLALTGEWRSLRALDIPRGVLIAVVVCLPWHVAIFLRDGMPWLSEYVNEHLLGRAFRGVRGDRGGFAYYVSQLGVGMWPWICLVPGALVAACFAPRARSRDGKVRLFMAAWAIVTFAFFSFVQTKFHHYILPAVPGFAALLALWLDGVWDGRVTGAAITVALGLFAVTSIDLVSKQERLVRLFIYGYERPWPYAAPWNLDFSPTLCAFAVGFGALLTLLVFPAPALRRAAILLLMAAGLAFCVWNVDVFMAAAAPHWGQRALHQRYFRERAIHGVDLTYYDGHTLDEEWRGDRDLVVKTVIPDTLHVGDTMTVRWQLRDAGEHVKERGALAGTVATIDAADDEFTIAVSAGERARIAHHKQEDGDARRYLYVNADRMIAWQLNWRGENFWTNGEIWNPRDDDMQTVFPELDSTGFLQWLRRSNGKGRTFWVVTELDSLKDLKTILPTKFAKASLVTWNDLSNKFGLARFTLDSPPATTLPTLGDPPATTLPTLDSPPATTLPTTQP